MHEQVTYQGFSLLTANREVVARRELRRMAERYGRTVIEIVFRFALEIGMIPLTGTSGAEHMRADLSVFNFRLTPEDIALIEGLVG